MSGSNILLTINLPYKKLKFKTLTSILTSDKIKEWSNIGTSQKFNLAIIVYI